MYAMAKNVARPARTSVKNLAFSRAFEWPDPWSLNLLPMMLLATLSLIFFVKPSNVFVNPTILKAIPAIPGVDEIWKDCWRWDDLPLAELIDTQLEITYL